MAGSNASLPFPICHPGDYQLLEGAEEAKSQMESGPLALLLLLASPSLPGGCAPTGGHRGLWLGSEGQQAQACPCMYSSPAPTYMEPLEAAWQGRL